MKRKAAALAAATMLLMAAGCQNSTDKPQATETPKVEQVENTETGINENVENTQGEEKENNEAETSENIEIENLLPGFETYEKTEALKAINDVLQLKEPVVEGLFMNKDQDTNELASQSYYLNEQDQVFLGYDLESPFFPDAYTVTDLDGDGIPEVIVRLSTDTENWVKVLRYHKHMVYGYSFTGRSFQWPKVDGTYRATSDAFENAIKKLEFYGADAMEKTLAESVSKDDSMKYYIDNQEVSEEEYKDYKDADYDKTELEWTLFSSDIRAGYTSEMLFHADYTAKTHATCENIETYYSDFESETTVIPNNDKIPQALTDLILDTMNNSRENEVFVPMEIGDDISENDFAALTGFDLDTTSNVTPIKTDVDNDGIDDIICLNFWGGTGGFSSMDMYQGHEDGSYEMTNTFSCLIQNFSILDYEDKHYLIMQEFNYYTKYYNGYTLYLYEDGMIVSAKRFAFDLDGYDETIVFESTTFGDMDTIKETLGNRKLPEIIELNEGVIYGTGETKQEGEQYVYSSDIDNDGNLEYFNKIMWYPSNMGTVMQCMYDFKTSQVFHDLTLRLENDIEGGLLYTFWVDDFDGDNILYLYYGSNLDYSMYAYKLSGIH